MSEFGTATAPYQHVLEDPDYDVGDDYERGAGGVFLLLVALLFASAIALHALDLYLAPPTVVFPAPTESYAQAVRFSIRSTRWKIYPAPGAMPTCSLGVMRAGEIMTIPLETIEEHAYAGR